MHPWSADPGGHRDRLQLRHDRREPGSERVRERRHARGHVSPAVRAAAAKDTRRTTIDRDGDSVDDRAVQVGDDDRALGDRLPAGAGP